MDGIRKPLEYRSYPVMFSTKEDAERMLATLPLTATPTVADATGDGITGVDGAARRRFTYPNGMIEVDATPSAVQVAALAQHLPMAENARTTVAATLAAAPLSPKQIFGSALAVWYRAGACDVVGGKVTRRIDLSGNGRHELPMGALRGPSYVASDARINGQPTLTYQGEYEPTAERDATSVAWVRAAPGTTNRWICRIMCQEGPNLGINRYLFSDATANAFGVVRPAGSGSSFAQILQRNATANVNALVPTDGQYRRHVDFRSNSIVTDYHQFGTLLTRGENAGNVGGTVRQTGVNTAGTAWAYISIAEEIEVEMAGGPTLVQLSQVAAYLSYWYGPGVLT